MKVVTLLMKFPFDLHRVYLSKSANETFIKNTVIVTELEPMETE